MQSKQRPLPTGGRGQIKMLFSIKLCDWGRAEISSFTGFAMLAYPNFIELIYCLFNDYRVIRQDASLEITSRSCFHADTSTSQVRATNIHLFAVKDKHFKPMEQ